MTNALVLADRGSGTTTFLGLLYCALVYAGSASGDELRVHAPHGTLRALRGVYAEMMGGDFPSEANELPREELSFLLDFASRAPHWRAPGHRPTEVKIEIASLEAFADLRSHSYVSDSLVRARVASQIALVLVDAGRLPPEPDTMEEGSGTMWSRFDSMVARAFEVLGAYHRLDRPRRRLRLQPVFILTKFDRLPAALRRLTLNGLVPSPTATAARGTWLEEVLAPRLPRAWSSLRQEDRDSGFNGPVWFASWVGLDERDPGAPRIRRRSGPQAGSWEVDYPRTEFEALLALLHKLSSPIGDVAASAVRG